MKNIWEMNLREFEAAAKRGRGHKATGKTLPGEAEARTSLKMGEINGYSQDDIAYFYLWKTKNFAKYQAPVKCAYLQMLTEAALEGRAIPSRILNRVKQWTGLFVPKPPRVPARHREGRSFELAIKGLLKNNDWWLVHGTVSGQKRKKRIEQAWLERDGLVYDPLKDQMLKEDEFYRNRGAIKGQVFNLRDAARIMTRVKSYGPFTAEELKA